MNADRLGPVTGDLLGYRPRLRYLLIEIRAQAPVSLPADNVLAMRGREEATMMLFKRAWSGTICG